MAVDESKSPPAMGAAQQFGRTAVREWRRFLRLPWGAIRSLLADTYSDWNLHKAPRLGASLAYYTMLSIAPLLLVVIAVAGWAYGRRAAEGMLFWQLQDLIGPSGASAIQAILQSANHRASGLVATVLGLLTLFFSASTVVAELRDALNTVWDVAPREANSRWMSIVAMLRERSLAFAVVLAVGFLLLLSLVVSAWLSMLGGILQAHISAPTWVLDVFNFLVSLIVIAFLFALIYRVLPDVPLLWKDVVIGACGTSLLFNIGKMLIGWYLGRTSLANSYGAAGSLVVVLVWVYYSAQVFFLGAEFTKIYANRYGSKPYLRYRRVELRPVDQ